MLRKLALIGCLALGVHPAWSLDNFVADLGFVPQTAELQSNQAMSVPEIRALIRSVAWLDQVSFTLEYGLDGISQARQSTILASLGLETMPSRVAFREGPRGGRNRVAFLMTTPPQPGLRCPWRAMLKSPSGRVFAIPVENRQRLALSSGFQLNFQPFKRAQSNMAHSVLFVPEGSSREIPFDGARAQNGEVRLVVSDANAGARSVVGLPAASPEGQAIECLLDLYAQPIELPN